MEVKSAEDLITELAAYWNIRGDAYALAAAFRTAADLITELPVSWSFRGDEYLAHKAGQHSAAAFLRKIANELDPQP